MVALDLDATGDKPLMFGKGQMEDLNRLHRSQFDDIDAIDEISERDKRDGLARQGLDAGRTMNDPGRRAKDRVIRGPAEAHGFGRHAGQVPHLGGLALGARNEHHRALPCEFLKLAIGRQNHVARQQILDSDGAGFGLKDGSTGEGREGFFELRNRGGNAGMLHDIAILMLDGRPHTCA